jgi:hypothetical protein
VGNPRPVQAGCTGERARRNPTSCPESWSVGVPFNLKPRSFVSTAFQRIASTQPTYIPTKTRTGLLEKQFTKPPMILQCWGLSQAVLSAPSDNHPAGPNWLNCRGVDRRPKAPLTGAHAPRPLVNFAPEITRENREPSKQSMQKPLCNSPALAFASSQNRAQVQFFHAKSLQTFSLRPFARQQ